MTDPVPTASAAHLDRVARLQQRRQTQGQGSAGGAVASHPARSAKVAAAGIGVSMMAAITGAIAIESQVEVTAADIEIEKSSVPVASVLPTPPLPDDLALSDDLALPDNLALPDHLVARVLDGSGLGAVAITDSGRPVVIIVHQGSELSTGEPTTQIADAPPAAVAPALTVPAVTVPAVTVPVAAVPAPTRLTATRVVHEVAVPTVDTQPTAKTSGS